MSIILCILDGFGIGKKNQYNAISSAKTMLLGDMMDRYPSSKLKASETYVGLMDGQIGNSEIGHLTIGSGRIIENDLIRINKEVQNLSQNKNMEDFLSNVMSKNGRVHIIGLLSNGGVHSHCNQIYKLLERVIECGSEPVLHMITDGRDVSPNSAKSYVKKEYEHLIRTVSGRYYAMDRDQRWERTKLAYDLIVNGIGGRYESLDKCISANYNLGISDEFILPALIGKGDYSIKPEDGIIMANFRADRARQLTSEITQKAKFSDIISLSKYSENFDIKTLIEPIYIKKTLGDIIAQNKMKQLRIAETEKYAHVTYFFNGKHEQQLEGEKRIIIPSPQVSTYDLTPEMSAHAITSNLISAINSKEFDFIVVNYANADMLGHTGNMEVAIRSIEILDKCIVQVVEAAKKTGDTLIITADHGNIEYMYDEINNVKHTAHTLNPVPFIIIGDNTIKEINDGSLRDIAPTILSMMGIKIPQEMNGTNLVKH